VNILFAQLQEHW